MNEAPLDDEALAKELLEAPELPEGIEFSDLDEEARRELRTLPKALAETVGKHLVAAGSLMDDDSDAALEHARYAKAKASRVPIVREALGLVAYHTGNWAEALSELRAVRRMTRSEAHIAVIADAERALGRPNARSTWRRKPMSARCPARSRSSCGSSRPVPAAISASSTRPWSRCRETISTRASANRGARACSTPTRTTSPRPGGRTKRSAGS